MTSKSVFVNPDSGHRASFLSAKKVDDGDDRRWETEDECMKRLEESYNINSENCQWSEDRNGFECLTDVKAVDDTAIEDPPQEETPVDDEPEIELEVEEVNDKEESEVAPELKDEPTETKDVRIYDLNESNEPLGELEEIFSSWPLEGNDKFGEEVQEYFEGPDVPAKIKDSVVTMTSDAANRELLSVIIVGLKILHRDLGLSVEQLMRLLALAQKEQFDRYHSKNDDK
jgi:hypothetical protein